MEFPLQSGDATLRVTEHGVGLAKWCKVWLGGPLGVAELLLSVSGSMHRRIEVRHLAGEVP